VELKIKDKQTTASARCRTIKAKGIRFLLGKFWRRAYSSASGAEQKATVLEFAAMMETLTLPTRRVAQRRSQTASTLCPAAVQAERAIPREQERKPTRQKVCWSSSMRRWILNSRGWTAHRILRERGFSQKRLRISASASLHAVAEG